MKKESFLEVMKSMAMSEKDAIAKIEKLISVAEIHDFVEGDTRKDVLDAASKRILRLRGGVTCEDVLINLRKKGYKV